jgi:hypothetical protein
VHMVAHPLIQTSGILSHPLSCTSLNQSLILEAPVDCSLSCSSSRGETRAPSGVAAHKYLWIMIFIQYNSHNFCIKLMVTQKGKHRTSCISLSTLLTLDHKVHKYSAYVSFCPVKCSSNLFMSCWFYAHNLFSAAFLSCTIFVLFNLCVKR